MMNLNTERKADCDLILKAAQIRKTLLQMIFEGKTGHTGGSLSSVDILTVLFYRILRLDPKNPKWEERDRFVLSKGHSVEGYYAILADKGFFPREELATFSKYKSRLIGHPSVKVPGVEMNTGALGHGLSCAVGMALGAGMDEKDVKVYCLMGDGEQAEGSIWEAAMAAANYGLDRLTGIIDRNHLQISGNTESVMKLENLAEKWTAFGWDVATVDGHDYSALTEQFLRNPVKGRPRLVIAETIKGKGVSFMENAAKWHHGVPSEEQLEICQREIEAVVEEAEAYE